ncbi:MAG: hypothetical protein R3F43_10065 [bacterium]
MLTNNSSKSRDVYRDRLASLGMQVALDQVLTSGEASADWLFHHTALRRPFVLGTPALVEACERAGLTPVGYDQDPDCVLLGFDTTLTYARLADACLLVAAGLALLRHPRRPHLHRSPGPSAGRGGHDRGGRGDDRQAANGAGQARKEHV